ncbi:MAG: hypothetical protein H6811_00735 [Phycisphaeraceae bacterium]|nr:hypothetical protein [Phycisphaeraceae bacterium]
MSILAQRAPIVLAVMILAPGRAIALPPSRSQPEPMSMGDMPVEAYELLPLAGFDVRVHPDVDQGSFEFLRLRAAVLFDLEMIAHVLPEAATARLRETPILLTPAMKARGGWDPACAAYHASADWLTANGLDAAREGSVEIFSFDRYELWRCEQPMMMLHELAHAYHAIVRADHPEIERTFAAARESGRYERVTRATEATDRTGRAYALTNSTEYFAELSEAYFGRNDFFPYTRGDLREFDPAGFDMIESAWAVVSASPSPGDR